MKIKAIIFDMDGVLIDSEQLHVKSGNTVLEKFGLTLDNQDDYNFKGSTDQDFYTHLIQKHKLKTTHEELSKERNQKYLELARQELGAFPNIEKVLHELSKKYVLAITTSGPKSTVNLMFKKFGWKKYFKVVTTCEEVNYGKPNPEPYLKTIEKLKLKPSECIVIEDALKGIESGKLAGAYVIAVTHSFPEEQIIKHKIKPDQIAHNLLDVLEKIKEIEETK
ncbi:MAG: HAD family phosphatase [Candidatus Diapherotrites archaeon]|nr:HAD family phosphatase [Candidatus Diapherotrites archaeon]